MYQVGQSVISKNNGLLYFIYRIEVGGSFNYNYLSTIDGSTLPVPCYDNELRPATEAEILAEAVKHGWVRDENGNYDQKTKAVWIFFHPDLERYVINSDPYEVEDYSIFGQECITAHRLITALNLTK